MFEPLPTPEGTIRRTSSFRQFDLPYADLFFVMDEPLRFHTNYLPLVESMRDAFGQYQPAGVGTELACEPLVFHLVVDTKNPQRVARRLHLQVHATGHLLSLTLDHDNFVVIDLCRGFATGRLSQDVAEMAEFVRYSILEAVALAMIGPARGFVALHAACVVRRGHSLLLQADAGVGKSTLAFACVRRGYQILADDVVHAKIRPGSIQLWSVPWRLHLVTDSLRFFPDLQDAPQVHQANGETKVEVDLAARYPDAAVTDAPPGLVVFLTRGADDQPAMFRPISPAEARARFEIVWPWQVGWRPEFDTELERLLQGGTYHLSMQGTPDQTAALLDALLDHHLSRTST